MPDWPHMLHIGAFTLFAHTLYIEPITAEMRKDVGKSRAEDREISQEHSEAQEIARGPKFPDTLSRFAIHPTACCWLLVAGCRLPVTGCRLLVAAIHSTAILNMSSGIGFTGRGI